MFRAACILCAAATLTVCGGAQTCLKEQIFLILVSDLPHLYTGSMRSVTLQEAALFRKTGHHYPGVLQTLALQFAILHNC